MKHSNDTYLKLIAEVREANKPAPEGAFTMAEFVIATGIGRTRAKKTVEDLVAEGRMKELGKFVSGPGKPRMHYMAIDVG